MAGYTWEKIKNKTKIVGRTSSSSFRVQKRNTYQEKKKNFFHFIESMNQLVNNTETQDTGQDK
ncbi:hypothetical protein DERP_012031 [Dermatophagoides pteronyssinus]|uniref:Uncharacterized protein n=1 Tax=Dermatophagoides pteronyssinus TaxID=6956 RepID=A0ABQ8IVN2_DERPT|nr:hypothetical protein DERP_012031 [Dermatophagoides pteronyssinus]